MFVERKEREVGSEVCFILLGFDFVWDGDGDGGIGREE